MEIYHTKSDRSCPFAAAHIKTCTQHLLMSSQNLLKWDISALSCASKEKVQGLISSLIIFLADLEKQPVF